MKKGRTTFIVFMAALFAIGVSAGPALADVLINEVDADQDGTDSAEFVELYDGGVGNSDLTGLVLVLMNGSDDASYLAFDLDGQSTSADGYFVLCGNAATVANCDLDVSPDTNLIQNGADAVALYVGDDTDFPNDTPVTTVNLIDAIVYDTDDSDDAGLLVLLNAEQPQVNERDGGSGTTHSNQRCPNGSGGARNTDTYDQFPPTSGAANTCPDCEDVDEDGYDAEWCGGDDCDDTNATIYPGADEVCDDEVDNDCDGYIDGGDWDCCTDADGDNYFDVNDADCDLGDDCDDSEPDINPGAQEICDDEIDNDCDDLVDQADPDCVIVDDVFINELRNDQPGSDYDEYFELIGPASTALDGLSYVVIGDGTGGSGVVEAVVDLAGGVMPASGLFVVAEATFTIGVADLTATINFENGQNSTHMLVHGFAGSNGDDLDIDDDGVLDSTPWTALVDCVAVIDTDPAVEGNQVYCATQVGPDGSNPPAHAYVCPSGWWMGPYELAGIDTPGAANICNCWDVDGDGYFDELCGGDDCDDLNEDVFPSAAEICDDLIDNDCDDLVDLDDPDCCWDNDADGYDDEICGGDDCDDSDANVHPGMQGQDCSNAPDGVDNDCDGQIDEDQCGCFLSILL